MLKDVIGSSVEECQIVITSLVDKELRDRESRLLLDSIGWNIQVVDPPKRFLKKVERSSVDFGGKLALSDTDMSVIALALYFVDMYGLDNVVVFSEDFDIQNMLAVYGLKFKSIQGKTIKRILKVKKKCVVCGTVYSSELSECPNCGSKEFKIVVERH